MSEPYSSIRINVNAGIVLSPLGVESVNPALEGHMQCTHSALVLIAALIAAHPRTCISTSECCSVADALGSVCLGSSKPSEVTHFFSLEAYN